MDLSQLYPFDMCCPSCDKTQKIKIRSIAPQFTSCCHCKTYLAVFPTLQTKTNSILFQLHISKVDAPAEYMPYKQPDDPEEQSKPLELVVA